METKEQSNTLCPVEGCEEETYEDCFDGDGFENQCVSMCPVHGDIEYVDTTGLCDNCGVDDTLMKRWDGSMVCSNCFELSQLVG